MDALTGAHSLPSGIGAISFRAARKSNSFCTQTIESEIDNAEFRLIPLRLTATLCLLRDNAPVRREQEGQPSSKNAKVI